MSEDKPALARFHGFKHYAYKKQKPGFRLHNFLDDGFSAFGKKTIVLGIAFIAIILGGAIMYQDPNNPLFHSQTANPAFNDPLKALWYDCIPQAGAWQTILMTFQTAGACAPNFFNNDFQSAPNSTNPAIMLYQPQIGIDQASGKVLEFDFSFATSNTGTLSQTSIYLTTNSTLPLTHSYNPYNDPNVGFLISFNGGQMNVYTQTVAGKSIQSQDGGCPHSGSVFLCMTYGSVPVNVINQISLQLNFTGVTNTPSISNLAFWTCPGLPCTSIASKTQVELPQLSLTSTYHLGIWQQANGAARQVTWYGSYDPPNPNPNANNQENSMTIGLFTPNPPSNQPAPYIDTGGFFGPIIRWFITGGVYIIANLVSFGNYISNLMQPVWTFLGTIASAVFNTISSFIITVLNTIGSLFGDPNLGNQLASMFTAVATVIDNVLTAIVALATNLFTFIVDITMFLFDSVNGLLTYWIGTVIFGFFAVLISISNIIVTVLKVVQVGYPFAILADLIWLLTEAVDNDTEGAMKWWNLHEILIVNAAKLMWLLFTGIATLVYQSISAIEQGAADVKPEVIGFSP